MSFGVLGMNARNLLYVKQRNSKRGIYLANNKEQTKTFLEKRGISVAKTYALIKSITELNKFDFETLPKSFVIKPNKGSRGRGIFLVKKQINSEGDTMFEIRKKIYTKKELIDLIKPILFGLYSLGNMYDSILIEQMLTAGEGFDDFCEYGLADIRIIVFNLVPIMAMLRMPTKQSGGRANLDQGGIGFGIDIGTGKIKTLKYSQVLYTENFPSDFIAFYKKKIPYRDDILLQSSTVQYFINSGYLGLDRVITKEGPKLLEINAKPGLKIQNVNYQGLEQYINKINDMDITSPEKAIEIAKALFVQEKSDTIDRKKVIYLSQTGDLERTIDGKTKRQNIIAAVDTTKKSTYVSSQFFEELKKSDNITFISDFETKEIKNIAVKPSKHVPNNTIKFGNDIVSDFFISPHHKVGYSFSFLNPQKIIEKEKQRLQILDQEIRETRKSNHSITMITKPINLIAEFDQFVSQKGMYNPRFQYQYPTDKSLQQAYDDFLHLKNYYFQKQPLQSSFAKLFEEKIDELLNKITYIKAHKQQNFDDMLQANIIFFKDFNQDYLKQAQYSFVDYSKNTPLYGKKLNNKKIMNILKKTLSQIDPAIKIELIDGGKTRFNVVKKEEKIILQVSSHLHLRQGTLEGIIAHEISTHIQRFINAQKMGRSLLTHGTAQYHIDEEGIAVYKAEQIYKNYDPQYINYPISQKYRLLNQAQSLNFSQLCEMLFEYFPNASYKNIFSRALRIKRGTANTSIIHPGTVHFKDKIYLDGYHKINNRVNQGGDIKKLMIGKIKIEDGEYLW